MRGALGLGRIYMRASPWKENLKRSTLSSGFEGPLNSAYRHLIRCDPYCIIGDILVNINDAVDSSPFLKISVYVSMDFKSQNLDAVGRRGKRSGQAWDGWMDLRSDGCYMTRIADLLSALQRD